MKIKITQCSIPSFWYADKIGEEYKVLGETETEDGYIVDMGNAIKCIVKHDCEIIPDKIRRFPSGAIRSDNTGRERYDFISPLALKELAQYLAATENSFAQVNYFLGIPEDACVESLLRHVNDYQITPNKKEAIAILFNAVALVHTIALKERGEYVERYDKTELITREQYEYENN